MGGLLSSQIEKFHSAHFGAVQEAARYDEHRVARRDVLGTERLARPERRDQPLAHLGAPSATETWNTAVPSSAIAFSNSPAKVHRLAEVERIDRDHDAPRAGVLPHQVAQAPLQGLDGVLTRHASSLLSTTDTVPLPPPREGPAAAPRGMRERDGAQKREQPAFTRANSVHA